MGLWMEVYIVTGNSGTPMEVCVKVQIVTGYSGTGVLLRAEVYIVKRKGDTCEGSWLEV